MKSIHNSTAEMVDSYVAVEQPSIRLSPIERRHKFKLDKKYFLSCICEELRKGDKYRRGLITVDTFTRVMKDLGLEYGSEELDLLLKYCIITDDGYVYYKDLLMEMLPLFKAQNTRDSVAEAMNPVEHMKLDAFDASTLRLPSRADIKGFNNSRLLTPERSEQVRKLYAQWDKCNLKDHELKHYLQLLGFPISFEFERLLATYGPSRTLPFGDMLKALQIDNVFTERKARKFPFETPAPQEIPIFSRHAHKTSNDVITWKDTNVAKTQHYRHGDAVADDSEALDEKGEAGISGSAERNRRIAAAVGHFLNCSSQSPYFILQLQRLGVKIDTPLSNLIRSHQADNRGCFANFMRIIHMQLDSIPKSTVPVLPPSLSLRDEILQKVPTTESGSSQQRKECNYTTTRQTQSVLYSSTPTAQTGLELSNCGANAASSNSAASTAILNEGTCNSSNAGEVEMRKASREAGVIPLSSPLPWSHSSTCSPLIPCGEGMLEPQINTCRHSNEAAAAFPEAAVPRSASPKRHVTFEAG